MAAAESSSSLHWRQQGNDLYKGVSDGDSSSTNKDKLKQAIQCYQRAFDTGKTEDDLTSAAKNLGMAGWKLVKLLSDGDVGEISFLDSFMVLYQCKEVFKYFSYAYIHGMNVKSPQWMNGLLTSTRACWEDLFSNYIEELELDTRAQALYDITQTIEIDSVKTLSYLKLGECHFHRGIIALQGSDFKKCLSAMRDCYMPVMEAKRLCKDKEISTEINILDKDVLMHQCMAESIQARVTGDALYDKVLKEEETLNMDMVWEVIDWYKQSTLRTREITEVELEAIAVSRIGRVYDKILKLKYRAKEYFKHSVQLAHSMHPRTFALEDWYKEATQTLARYQTETINAEEEKKQQEKKEYLKQLETEIKQLNEKRFEGDEDFLRFIYKTFPPKKKTHKLNLPKHYDHDKVKKALQKAVVHYHPDSVDVEKFGKKWKYLCEEITKYFTQRYERMK